MLADGIRYINLSTIPTSDGLLLQQDLDKLLEWAVTLPMVPPQSVPLDQVRQP